MSKDGDISMQICGCRPIFEQEKQMIVNNFAHFQQFCRPGTKCNNFVLGEDVPRQEAACAIWIIGAHCPCLIGRQTAQ